MILDAHPAYQDILPIIAQEHLFALSVAMPIVLYVLMLPQLFHLAYNAKQPNFKGQRHAVLVVVTAMFATPLYFAHNAPLILFLNLITHV